MTLGELLQLLGDNPLFVLSFFSLIPLTALLAWLLGRNEGHMTPWKYLYSFLIYMVCIPGIFAVTLAIYQFLFEKQSIMDAGVFTQILPIMSMVLTLWLVRQNVSFDAIPGFGKLGGLITLISIVLVFMWFLDRTRIYVFSYMRIEYVLFIFAGLFLLGRWATMRLLR